MDRPGRFAPPWLFLALTATLAAGCALTPQSIVLKPEVQVAPSSVGAGRVVLLTVADERPKATLGTRGRT